MGDLIADAAGYLAAAAALLGTLWKVLIDRGRRSDPALRHAYACGLLLGTAMAVTAPATASAAARVLPRLSYLTLVGDQLKLAAVGSLAMMAYSTQPAEAARRGVRRQTAITAATMLASIAVFALAHPTRVGDNLGTDGPGRPVLTAYIALFTLHCVWCLVLFGLLVGRAAWHLRPGILRLGLQLMAASAVAGLLWTADNLNDATRVLTTGQENGAESPLSAIAAAVCVTLGFAGATAPAWAGRLTRGFDGLRARYDHHRLEPLWAALHALLPAIELVTAPPSRVGDPRFARYRRIIEIRDGQLALRPHLHAEVPRWIAESIDADGETGAAETEAAFVAAGLEAARLGHRFPADARADYLPHQVTAGVDQEAAWLVKVSEAFTGSPAVDRVRRRVRDELGRSPAPG